LAWSKLEKLDALARRLIRMARGKARRFHSRNFASFTGRAQSLRLAVPDTAFRLRVLYDVLIQRRDTFTMTTVPFLRGERFGSLFRDIACGSRMHAGYDPFERLAGYDPFERLAEILPP
jgi:hypothetical protein